MALRWRYELGKEWQDLHIDVVLLSETHLKPREWFFISNNQFHRTDRYPGWKSETAVLVRKSILHNHVDLPPLFSIEATGICMPFVNSELLLAAVYKSPAAASMSEGSTDGQSEKCPICLCGFVTQEVGTAEACNHSFCVVCL
jgi:hypothetical protein